MVLAIGRKNREGLLCRPVMGTGGEGIETGGKVKVSGGRGEEGGAETPPLSAHRCETSIKITAIFSSVISIGISLNLT